MADLSLCAIYQQNRKNGMVFSSPGTRYTPINPYQDGFTKQQLDMRRKAEILQYNKTSNGKLTKKQSWVNLVRGATQRKQYSSYYIKGLADGTSQMCPNDITIPTLTTSCDVPGPPMLLYYDPTIPLYNYNSYQIAYATQQSDEQKQSMWLSNYAADVTDNNNQNIFTMNIRPSIDSAAYIYSFTTSIGLYVSGSSLNNDPSGIFTMQIPRANLNLAVRYGGQDVTLSQPFTITYSPHFLTDISGYTESTFSSFEGTVYMGDLTFSNILLNTAPNSTYDFYIEYIPSYTINNINNASVSIITNFKNDNIKMSQTGLIFSSPPSIDSITTFALSGVPI